MSRKATTVTIETMNGTTVVSGTDSDELIKGEIPVIETEQVA